MKSLITSIFFTVVALSFSMAQETYVAVLDGTTMVNLSPIFVDLNLSKGNAKTAIPLKLPEGATACYYAITVLPKNKKAPDNMPLLDQVKQLNQSTDALAVGNLLQVPKTGRRTNVYILKGRENANGLENYQCFTYQEKYIEHHSFTGYLDATDFSEFYIGLENAYELKGVKVKIEVVAVVM